MSYLFKEKFNLQDLAVLAAAPAKIMIYETEDYLAALYAHYLKKHNFDIKHCPELVDLKAAISDFSPDVLLFALAGDNSWMNDICALRQVSPKMEVVTVGYKTNGEMVKSLMAAGVSGHIDRYLSRPQDVAMIIKTILNY